MITGPPPKFHAIRDNLPLRRLVAFREGPFCEENR
jgi:hypothetical protein